jgi:hypothetical protein
VKARPVFVLRLQPLKGVDSIRSLRLALKALLRRHGPEVHIHRGHDR